MDNGKVQQQHLMRKAYVYIRQSTTHQVENNQESGRRQYQLVERAQQLGFRNVNVIDEDLGMSGAESKQRTGFQKLIAEISLGEVGMIIGLEVSRFARNNKDWYHLLDLCALFDTLIADQDGIYHPADPNDRMLLGLKGTISEVELSVLRNRMLEGSRNKARRGALFTKIPIGFVKSGSGCIEKDPNERVREMIDKVFAAFLRIQSIHGTYTWLVKQEIPFPRVNYGKFGREIIWGRPTCGGIRLILKNPTYAGAYAYGKTESRIRLQDGEVVKTSNHRREMGEWDVLLKDQHIGYISWEQYERNQAIIEGNFRKVGGQNRGPVLGGQSLLAGLIRCKRCGRRVRVHYGGRRGKSVHYRCDARKLAGKGTCLSFGGTWLDEMVGRQAMEVVKPLAIEASIRAIEDLGQEVVEKQKSLELALQDVQYQTERAYRQYNKVDPENRLVASQLEKTWNDGLEQVDELKQQIALLATQIRKVPPQERRELMALAQDLPAIWKAGTTTQEMRKRILRTLIEVILVDIDEPRAKIIAEIQWKGSHYTTLEIAKKRNGQQPHYTDADVILLIRQLAAQFPDEGIVPTLNKLGFRTKLGYPWTVNRLRSFRKYHKISEFDPQAPLQFLTLQQVAAKLEISSHRVRYLIDQGLITASQVCKNAPWAIPVKEIGKEGVEKAVESIQSKSNSPREGPWQANQQELFP